MLHDLMLNGFVIYPKEDKFFLEKIAVPTFPAIITAQAFDTYEQALNYAADVLQEHKEKTLREYSTIVRYNRGLGIEYKNLPVIYAANIEEGKIQAQHLAEKILRGAKILEIRVRPKGNYE
jgi:predicted RNase H-like HicB family nuclease